MSDDGDDLVIMAMIIMLMIVVVMIVVIISVSDNGDDLVMIVMILMMVVVMVIVNDDGDDKISVKYFGIYVSVMWSDIVKSRALTQPIKLQEYLGFHLLTMNKKNKRTISQITT